MITSYLAGLFITWVLLAWFRTTMSTDQKLYFTWWDCILMAIGWPIVWVAIGLIAIIVLIRGANEILF